MHEDPKPLLSIMTRMRVSQTEGSMKRCTYAVSDCCCVDILSWRIQQVRSTNEDRYSVSLPAGVLLRTDNKVAGYLA